MYCLNLTRHIFIILFKINNLDKDYKVKDKFLSKKKITKNKTFAE